MNSNVIKLFLALCALLLLILFIEWELAEPSENQDIEILATKEKPQNQSQKLTVIKLSEQPIESYSQMVNSPLFIKERKPVAGVVEETEELGAGNIEDLFLVGIYSSEESLIALFSKKGIDRKYLKKAKGDDVSGWMLEEIQADKVILERDGNKQTLMLRAPKPKSKFKAKLPKRAKPVARKKIKPNSDKQK